MPRPLIKYEEYTREEVHDIFASQESFNSGAGSWGQQSQVKIPNRKNDYVFFVTFGRSQAGHTFDESVTENGMLVWQSQPSQELKNSRIKKFIKHNHLIDNIYLFLRTNPKFDYTYLGRLAYISHDPDKEKPVYFKWQILDWDLSYNKAKEMGLELIPDVDSEESPQDSKLIQTEPPALGREHEESSTNRFQGRQIDFTENDSKNKKLGNAGELLVLRYEKEYLINNGRSDLAKKVFHTSYYEGDGAGYDILSYTIEGKLKYIEVKTTTGGKGTPFILTLNEVAFSQQFSDNYYLYRVYKFNNNIEQGEFYIISGDVAINFNLKAVQFKAKR